ncbi:MAG: hypothetical protein ORN98_09020 [Alphaproteobacteria bacterium]|nr:hypothetical protein [Alphaproteobacteria bacterium]
MKIFTISHIGFGLVLTFLGVSLSVGLINLPTAQAGAHRSASAKREFMRLHPCPANERTRGRCPGYVIDHVIPLDCAGADDPNNMQWQTIAEGKAKDKWERNGANCRHRTHGIMRTPIDQIALENDGDD